MNFLGPFLHPQRNPYFSINDTRRKVSRKGFDVIEEAAERRLTDRDAGLRKKAESVVIRVEREFRVRNESV
jgi:hypothetical protein